MNVYEGHPEALETEYLIGFFPESMIECILWGYKRKGTRPIASPRINGTVTYAIFASKKELVAKKGDKLIVIPWERFRATGQRIKRQTRTNSSC